MPSKTKKSSTPEIGKILEKRKGPKSKLVEYLIHWKGYGKKDDTWELRKDLVADGHGSEIRAWEKEQKAGAKKKTPAKPKRGRSKSPAPKKAAKKKSPTPKKKAKSKSPTPKKKATKKRSKSPTPKKKSPTPKKKSPAKTPASTHTPESLPVSYKTIDLVTENVNASIILFVFGVIGTVTLRVIENDGNIVKDADAELLVNVGKLIVEPIAPLWCLFATLRSAPAGPMTNPACAAMLWVTCLAILENLGPIVKSQTSTGFEAQISVYVAIFMWQMMTLNAVFKSGLATWVLGAAGSAGAVHAMRTHWFVEGSNVDPAATYAQYAIVGASVFAMVSAIVNVGAGHSSLFSTGALPQWILAFAVIMGSCSVAIVLTEMNTSLDLGTVDATSLWVASNLMRWFFCSAFALATVTQQA